MYYKEPNVSIAGKAPFATLKELSEDHTARSPETNLDHFGWLARGMDTLCAFAHLFVKKRCVSPSFSRGAEQHVLLYVFGNYFHINDVFL